MRARIKRAVQAGEAVCWRCHRPILPTEPWDLGHDDRDPTHKRYAGPEHRGCNRATKSHAKAQRMARRTTAKAALAFFDA